MNKTGRPVLVGTTSVEQSDSLSEQLKEAGIPHEVRSVPSYDCGYSIRGLHIIHTLEMSEMNYLSLSCLQRCLNL